MVTNLRTEYKTNPLGIDVTKPRFSWEIVSKNRNTIQSAYEIKAAVSDELLKADKELLWNTEKVNSDRSNQIEYNGPTLKSGQRIYWKVRIWDGNGRVSEWSEAAFWEMGLLEPSDWKASWIEPDIVEDITISQPCPMLRKEFEVKGDIKQARLYVSSHGLYQTSINGKKIGNQVFTPGWTSYNKRLQYQVYDVSSQLVKGKNAIGAILGDGWYRGFLGWEDNRNVYGDKLALILQMKIIYDDGSEIVREMTPKERQEEMDYRMEVFTKRLIGMMEEDLEILENSEYLKYLEKELTIEN